MKFPAFAYAEPTTVAEAVTLLAADEDARPLAGGQTLLPMLALRLAAPTCLVDLNALGELRDIAADDTHVKVGAMVTHAQNASSEIHREHLPLLTQAVQHVAHEAIRNRGTIGGSIANADAAAEMSLVALALDAVMVIATTDGERRVNADDFFQGHYTTDIQPGELLIQIEFPKNDFTWAFDEVARRPGDFALGMAASGIRFEAGRCDAARIAIGSVGDRPSRATEAESYLVGQVLTADVIDEAARIATNDLEANEDIHASATYRRSVAGTLVRRTLARLAAEKGNATN